MNNFHQIVGVKNLLLTTIGFVKEQFWKPSFQNLRIIKLMCFCFDFAQIHDFDSVYRYGHIHFSILAADNNFNWHYLEIICKISKFHQTIFMQKMPSGGDNESSQTVDRILSIGLHWTLEALLESIETNRAPDPNSKPVQPF